MLKNGVKNMFNDSVLFLTIVNARKQIVWLSVLCAVVTLHPVARAATRVPIIEFRASSNPLGGDISGHSWISFGTQNPDGSDTKMTTFYGFYPNDSDAENISFLLTKFSGVPGYVNKKFDAARDTTNKFRTRISRRQHENALKIISEWEKGVTYTATGANCTQMVLDVARGVGLNVKQPVFNMSQFMRSQHENATGTFNPLYFAPELAIKYISENNTGQTALLRDKVANDLAALKEKNAIDYQRGVIEKHKDRIVHSAELRAEREFSRQIFNNAGTDVGGLNFDIDLNNGGEIKNETPSPYPLVNSPHEIVYLGDEDPDEWPLIIPMRRP